MTLTGDCEAMPYDLNKLFFISPCFHAGNFVLLPVSSYDMTYTQNPILRKYGVRVN